MAGKNDTTEKRPASSEEIDESQLQGKTPLDQLLVYLETRSVRSVLRNLEPEDQKEFTFLMGQVMDSAGRESMGVLNSVAKFLSVRGVQIKYIRNEDVEKHAVQPLGEESPSGQLFCNFRQCWS